MIQALLIIYLIGILIFVLLNLSRSFRQIILFLLILFGAFAGSIPISVIGGEYISRIVQVLIFIIAGFYIISLYINSYRLRVRWGMIIAVSVLMALMIIHLNKSTSFDYGFDKTLLFAYKAFVPFVIIMMFGPLSKKDLRYIKNAILTGISFLVIISIYYFDVTDFRFYLPNVMPPLGISRFLAAGAIILLFYAIDIEQKRETFIRIIYSILASVCLFLIFATGSRGPAIYVVIGILATLFINNKLISRKKLVTYTLISILGASIIVYIGYEIGLPGFTRIATLFPWLNVYDSHSVDSITARLDVYKLAIVSFIDNNFLALGTGSFKTLHRLDYPHNIVLEMMMELGIFSIITLFAVYIYSFIKIKRIRNIVYSENLIYIGLFIFAFFDSMTSGDIAKNHFFFVFTAILLNISYFQKIEVAQKQARGKDFSVEKIQNQK